MIVVATIMLLAGLVVPVARSIYIKKLEDATRVKIEVIQNALCGYYRKEGEQFPFWNADPPSQQPEGSDNATVSAAIKLIDSEDLSAKEARDNKLDAWKHNMLYLIYDYDESPPVVELRTYPGVSSGDWASRINALMSTHDFDYGSAHPVIGSPGADGVFGTDADGNCDDIYNDRSL